MEQPEDSYTSLILSRHSRILGSCDIDMDIQAVYDRRRC